MNYKNLLMDIDGTLLDFHRSEREALKDALAALGVEADDRMLKGYSQINDSLWKLLERGEIDRQALKYRRFEMFIEKYGVKADSKKLAELYVNALSEKGYVFDGAIELCKALNERAKTYIVTNGTLWIQEKRLQVSGLLPYFDGVFISEKLGSAKPSPVFFEKVAAEINDFSKESTVIVGDSLTSDIAGGIAFGIDTVWYNPDGKPTPKELEGKITCVAKSYGEIFSFICEGDNR